MFPIPGLRVKLFYWSQPGKDVEGQKKAEGLACWWVRFDLIFLFPARCLPPSSQHLPGGSGGKECTFNAGDGI